MTYVIIQCPDGLTGVFTDFANEVFIWCADCGIEADLIAKWNDDDGQSLSRWSIPDEKQRMMFMLRWA